jgi:hypothetical protein
MLEFTLVTGAGYQRPAYCRQANAREEGRPYIAGAA